MPIMRYKSAMRILAIETSCDETAVCIIEASGGNKADFKFDVLGNALNSQIEIHALYGGVFPNLAKREHAKNLVPLMTQALEQAGLLCQGQTLVKSVDKSQGQTLVKEMLVREEELYARLVQFIQTYEKPDVDAIAVTYGPGLEPALWVGVNFARALSMLWNIPIVAVNHMEGHVMMSLVRDDSFSDFDFPILSLLISGGHTELVLSRNWMQYEVIGATRDDAVGEAFDKVARLLSIPYPGGPGISALAKRERELHPESQFKFTPPMLRSDDFDFSFSGIKTEVRKYVDGRTLEEAEKMAIARAFEDAVTEVLVAKTIRAVEEIGIETVIVGGGVSANTNIRLRLAEALAKAGNIPLLLPPAAFATDNALMIALAGFFHAMKKDFADPATLRANGNLKLAA